MAKKESNEPVSAIRADLWLWVARFYKTRAIAKHAIETGKVEIEGQAIKPSRLIKIQDRLEITRSNELFEITVISISEKRGSLPHLWGRWIAHRLSEGDKCFRNIGALRPKLCINESQLCAC